MSNSFPIIISQNHAVSSNEYVYQFPSSVDFNNMELCLDSCNMYYSWFNVTSRLNNNSFRIHFPSSTGMVAHTITLEDGCYSVPDLNAYLQFYCIQNNLYLIKPDGSYRIYFQLQENPTQYAVQLVTFPVPKELPDGWTKPSGFTFPDEVSRPQIEFLNNNFNELLGYEKSTKYPADSAIESASTYGVNSVQTPQLSAGISSILIGCNVITNKYSQNSTLIDSFTNSGISFGNIINHQNSNNNWIRCSGNTQELHVSFYDNQFRPLQLNDTNVTIKLLLRQANN